MLNLEKTDNEIFATKQTFSICQTKSLPGMKNRRYKLKITAGAHAKIRDFEEQQVGGSEGARPGDDAR